MPRGTMTTTLRNRLLLLLVLPVCVLAVAGSWWGYRSAETAAGQHDQPCDRDEKTACAQTLLHGRRHAASLGRN